METLALSDLSPLGDLLNDPSVAKIIHNASFERSVLKRYSFSIEGVVDTLQVSRRLRGAKLAGGHSLKAVCERELRLTLDKTEQVSDWSQRPLSERQQAYAALDSEILLRLYERFGRPAANDGEAMRKSDHSNGPTAVDP